MRTKVSLLTAIVSIASIFAVTTAAGAEARKLVAPIYPGAVSAIPAEGTGAGAFYTLTFDGGKTLDCAAQKESRGFSGTVISEEEAKQTGYLPGPWCFLSPDPIDRVKAFYDKSVGLMHPMQGDKGEHGFAVFAERAWYDLGEMGRGFEYSGVSVHALPPPPVKGKTPLPATYGEGIPAQEDYLFYAQFKHLGLFHQSIAWYGPEPGKRGVADLEAMSGKYGYLESAFFQHKGPELMPADQSLQKHYSELQGKRQTDALMARQTGGIQGMSAPQAGSAAGAEDDARFNAVMEKDPELARRYVALTQQLGVLMQQGKFDAADAVMDEIDALEQSNPELAAMNQQEEMRQDSLNSAGQAEDDAMDAAMNKQLDLAFWGTAMEYIEAVDKEDYYTLIVIDNAFDPSAEQYSGDRALIEPDTATLVHAPPGSWGISYPQSNADSDVPANNDVPPVKKDKDESVTKKAKGLFDKLKKP